MKTLHQLCKNIQLSFQLVGIQILELYQNMIIWKLYLSLKGRLVQFHRLQMAIIHSQWNLICQNYSRASKQRLKKVQRKQGWEIIPFFKQKKLRIRDLKVQLNRNSKLLKVNKYLKNHLKLALVAKNQERLRLISILLIQLWWRSSQLIRNRLIPSSKELNERKHFNNWQKKPNKKRSKIMF